MWSWLDVETVETRRMLLGFAQAKAERRGEASFTLPLIISQRASAGKHALSSCTKSGKARGSLASLVLGISAG